MNRLLGLCVLVTTGISIIIHRKEIKEAWDGAVNMLPHPGFAPQPVALVAIDGRVLREAMDITREQQP